MLFSDIRPFIRFARYQRLKGNICKFTWKAIDHRLFYVIKGSAPFYVDGEKTDLNTGDLIIIRSGSLYRFLDSSIELLAFNFDYTYEFSNLITPINPECITSNFKSSILENFTFDDANILNKPLVVRNCFSSQNSFLKIIDIYNKSKSYSSLQAGALFANVLVNILHKVEEEKEKLKFKSVFNDIVKYIHEHYTEPINNVQIANMLNYHPNYLSSKFKAHTGMPLHRYITEYRITMAIQLIDLGEINLNTISYKCGFTDYNYFSRRFKKTVGISPKEYIKHIHFK